MLVTEKPDGGPAAPELLEARIRGLQHALAQLLDNARRLTYGEHQRAVKLHRQLQEQTAAARRESRSLVDAKTAEALSEAEPKARLLADRLAPGLASIPPNDARWRSRHRELGTNHGSQHRMQCLLVDIWSALHPRLRPLQTGQPR